MKKITVITIALAITGMLQAATYSAAKNGNESNVLVSRVAPCDSNKHYLKDAAGNPMVILGDFVWSLDQAKWGSVNFTYQQYIDRLAANGVNLTDMTLEGANTDYDKVKTVTPWAWTGSKFDLNQWNNTYWNNYAAFAAYADTKGIIIHVNLWDETWHKNTSGNTTVWNKNNNTLGIGAATGFPGSVYDLNNSGLLLQQEKLMQKFLDVVGIYPNVVVRLGCEITAPTAWKQHWVDFIRNNSNSAVRDLVIMDNADYQGSPSFNPYTNSGIQALSYHNSMTSSEVWNDWGNRVLSNPDKWFENNTDGANSQEDDAAVRKMCWTSFALQGSPLSQTPRQPWTDNLDACARPVRLSFFKKLRNFINTSGIKPWNLTQNQSLIVSGNAYGMAKTGEYYFYYLPTGGTVQLNLGGTLNSFDVKWYDCINGVFIPGPPDTITGGSNRTFVSPVVSDAALWLVKKTVTPTVISETNLFYNMNVYPNPAEGKATIEFELAERKNVQISLCNLLGEEVSIVTKEEMSAGTHKLDISDHLNEAGIYFIRVKAGNDVINRKLIKFK